MTKKIATMLVLVTLLIGLFVLPAMADGTVEISFRVGENVLSINGVDTPVETPYVVGDGVTLVPLRVITEAFGATVEWVEETETINLSYPDVAIVLQIGNPTAEVNGKAEPLLAPPELTEAGYTMVPLRFISETFGATVSYDDATEAISVVKGTPNNGQTTVEGAITESKIGDSFYKWTMENPTDMRMENRSFDGIRTLFAYDESNAFYILITPLAEDFDLDRAYTSMKNQLKDATLVKADKDTANSSKKVLHFQAKTKTELLDSYLYVTPDYTMEVTGAFALDTPEIMNEGIRIMSTFDCTYTGQDTYDLSTAKNGKRVFEAEGLNLSFSVPDSYYLASSEDTQNEFDFYPLDQDDPVSRIAVGVYSKSDVGSAKELAEKDYNGNKTLVNESLVTFSDVADVQYNAFSGYEYSYEIKGSVGQDQYMRDVFFEQGDYVYNVSVALKMPNENVRAFIDDVINGVSAGPIDSSEAGLLLRNTYDDEGTYTSKTDDWSMELPYSFQEIETSLTSAVYADVRTGSIFSYENSSATGRSFADVRDLMKSLEADIKRSGDATIVSSTTTEQVGGCQYACLIIKDETENEAFYTVQYATVRNNTIHTFFVTIPEVSYSTATQETIKAILTSFQCN